MAKIRRPSKAPEGAMLRYETALDTLERVKRMNLEWIQPLDIVKGQILITPLVLFLC